MGGHLVSVVGCMQRSVICSGLRLRYNTELCGELWWSALCVFLAGVGV